MKRGFAFIVSVLGYLRERLQDYNEPADAEEAIKEMNGVMWKDKEMIVEEAGRHTF